MQEESTAGPLYSMMQKYNYGYILSWVGKASLTAFRPWDSKLSSETKKIIIIKKLHYTHQDKHKPS